MVLPPGKRKGVKKSDSSDRVKTVTLPTVREMPVSYSTRRAICFRLDREDGEMLTDEDAWQEGVYYCDPENGGRLVPMAGSTWRQWTMRTMTGKGMATGSISRPTAKSDGRTKAINGRKYRFNEYGAANSSGTQIRPFGSPTICITIPRISAGCLGLV